jgi:hypothetical protein
MPVLIALKLFGGKLLNGLASLNIWQILCIVLGLFCLMQTVRLHSEQRHSHKLEAQIVKMADQLRSISTTRNEQKQTSERNVDQVVKGDPKTRVVVKTIHDAPNPSDCRTPGLETLRNVL